jgi:uncharacterized protein (TIGR02270 family)
MTGARLIPEIVGRHSENAAGLWLTRDNAVKGSSFKLSDLIRLDERIEANIDGLRVAEMNGWCAALDELEAGGAGSFFVTGLLAVESGDRGRLDQIIELAYAKVAATASEPYQSTSNPWRGLVSALAWAEPAHALGAIERLLDTPRPRTRWLGVAACGARRIIRQRGLEAALADREPLVRARAARTMGELGRSDSRAALNSLLVDADESCRFWAARSAALLGTIEGLQVLAEIARVPGPWCESAQELLLRRLPIERANEFLRPLGHDSRWRRIVLRAIAVIGDPLYLPWLIGQFDDLTIAQRSGMAFATITGIDLDDLGWDLPLDFNAGPNRDPDDEGLAWLDPEKCRRWWGANGARFRVGTAYFQGKPKASVNWIGVLSEAHQGLRRAAAIELALQRSGQAMFEVRGRGYLQRRLLKRADGPPAR